MQREFTAEQRATMGSLTAFVGSITFAVWSFALGLLADRIGPINALLISQILSMIPLWLYWKAFRVKSTHSEKL
jgi:nitrate/nitrite transporter NarK